jgi:hypothetical protein
MPGIKLHFFGYPADRLITVLTIVMDPTGKGNIFKNANYIFRFLSSTWQAFEQ